MKVVTVNSEERDWDVFVRSAQDATSYHQLGWRRVIRGSFGHLSPYLVAIDEKGEWQGVLPLVHMRSATFGNFLVSLPFVNYGGLLCRTEAASLALLEQAERIRRSCGATHVELRHVLPSTAALRTKKHKVTMILDLALDVDGQWKAFDAKLRNQIRKAEKSGLKVSVGQLELLDEFYDVFARNMRDLGTPVYSKRFFRSVLLTFSETTRIFAVSHQGRTIAAGIAFWFRDTFEVPWASSINDYKALCPNNMLYWQAIRFAIEQGFHKFDFGRSTPAEGTYNFKRQWGALPVQLHWQYLIDNDRQLPELNPSNRKYRAAIRIWQRLPVFVTKLLGPMIVRNIP